MLPAFDDNDGQKATYNRQRNLRESKNTEKFRKGFTESPVSDGCARQAEKRWHIGKEIAYTCGQKNTGGSGQIDFFTDQITPYATKGPAMDMENVLAPRVVRPPWASRIA